MSQLSTELVAPDSSVLIDFERIGQLPMLSDLFRGRILLATFVRGELEDSGVTIHIEAQEVVFNTDEEWQLYAEIREKHQGLGPGESAALVIAVTRGAVMLANDFLARQAAEQRTVAVTGSLGVLKYAVTQKRTTTEQAVVFMEKMYEAGAWFSTDLMNDFRRQIKFQSGDGIRPSSGAARTSG